MRSDIRWCVCLSDEVAIIDEIQMMRDSQRGWAWTRGLLGASHFHNLYRCAPVNKLWRPKPSGDDHSRRKNNYNLTRTFFQIHSGCNLFLKRPLLLLALCGCGDGQFCCCPPGVNADEVHLCGEDSCIALVQEFAEALGDEFEVRKYKRLTSLTLLDKAIGKYIATRVIGVGQSNPYAHRGHASIYGIMRSHAPAKNESVLSKKGVLGYSHFGGVHFLHVSIYVNNVWLNLYKIISLQFKEMITVRIAM